MKKNILYISPMQARALALEAANVTSARFDSQKLLESGSLYELEFTTEDGQTQSFETLHYEVAPISLLSVDAAAGATPIAFTAPEK